MIANVKEFAVALLLAVSLVACGGRSEAEQQLDRWCERVGVALDEFFHAEAQYNAGNHSAEVNQATLWPPRGYTLEDIQRADGVCNEAEPTVGYYAND
jgi:hypothetical protein